MDADVVVTHSESQEYNVARRPDDGTREVMCFSYIVDQVLSDIGAEQRQQNTFANILACLHKSSDTWQEIRRLLGEFRQIDSPRGDTFTARYELTSGGNQIFGGTVDLRTEYQPANPKNLDGKLSVSTMLYTSDLEENLSLEEVEMAKEVMEEQLNQYQLRGFPVVGNRGAPGESLKKVLRK